MLNPIMICGGLISRPRPVFHTARMERWVGPGNEARYVVYIVHQLVCNDFPLCIPYSLICTSACWLSECNRWFFSLNGLPFPCFHCHLYISCTSPSLCHGITHTIGHHTFIMCSVLYISRHTCLLSLSLSLAVVLFTPNRIYFAQFTVCTKWRVDL